MAKEESEFKVVDRRVSSTGTVEKAQPESPKETPETPKEGSGFVMKDKPEDHQAAPQEIDFATFIFSLATSALLHLGLAPDPATKKVQKNVQLAKQNIDILGMIQEKTKGNLTAEEANLLEGLLAETRLRYVEASRT